MEETNFDVSELAKSDLTSIRRALSRFTPPLETTPENIRRYFLARAALKSQSQRVQRADVVAITSKQTMTTTMKSEIIVVPNDGRDLSFLPIEAIKVAEEIQNLPSWFNPKRFTLVDSNLKVAMKERLGFGLFTFEAAFGTSVVKHDEGADPQAALPPPPVQAAISGPRGIPTPGQALLR